MVLELAEGPRRKSKYITVSAYKRKSTVASHKRRRPVLNSGDNHIYVPAHLNDGYAGIWVREDKFDGLSDREWDITIDELLNFQPGMSDLSGRARREAKKAAKAEKKAKRTARKDEKKAAKAKKKADKNERKNTRVNAKAQAKLTRANAKQTRADAKLTKAGRSGSGEDEDGEGSDSTAKGIFQNIVAKGKGFIDKVKGGGGSAPEGGDEPEGGEGADKDSGSDEFDIFGMKVPKTAAYVGGGLLVLGLGYAVTTKRK